jgi:hypothetical protein
MWLASSQTDDDQACDRLLEALETQIADLTELSCEPAAAWDGELAARFLVLAGS